MNKNEGLYRALATRIWEETFPAEHIQDYKGKTCFVNMVSAGIASGVHAYSVAMTAHLSGNIDELLVNFEKPRIV